MFNTANRLASSYTAHEFREHRVNLNMLTFLRGNRRLRCQPYINNSFSTEGYVRHTYGHANSLYLYKIYVLVFSPQSF